MWPRRRDWTGLAGFILAQETGEPLEKEAEKYVVKKKEWSPQQTRFRGAKDIIAEAISDEADYRIYIRNITFEEGKIISTARMKKAASVYEMYYSYEEPVKKRQGHRILALNREKRKSSLTVKIEAPEERNSPFPGKKVITKDNPITSPVLQEVAADSITGLSLRQSNGKSAMI